MWLHLRFGPSGKGAVGQKGGEIARCFQAWPCYRVEAALRTRPDRVLFLWVKNTEFKKVNSLLQGGWNQSLLLSDF